MNFLIKNFFNRVENSLILNEDKKNKISSKLKFLRTFLMVEKDLIITTIN